MKVLILGGSGTLGSDLSRAFAEGGPGGVPPGSANARTAHEVFAPPHSAVDLLIPDQIRRAIDATAADVLVNCAALADVDRCEREPDRAWAMNADGVRYAALACAERGATLVQVSTDYVFDGKKGAPYVESDRTRPLQVYGKSKLSGEKNALEVGVKALVVRTSWLFGKQGKNFANRVLAAGRDGGEVKAVSDWFGSPTSTIDLSRAIRSLVEKGATGVMHVVNAGSQSRLEQAKEILAALDSHKATLVPVESATLLHLDAPRPRDTTLASERLDALGIRMRPRAEAVRELAS